LLARASREYNFSSSSVNRIGVILECRFSLGIFGLPGFLFFGFGTHELLLLTAACGESIGGTCNTATCRFA
jgi:hypothetical protein